MAEINAGDFAEEKIALPSEGEGFKEIKSESGLTVQESKDFLNSLFGSTLDKNTIEKCIVPNESNNIDMDDDNLEIKSDEENEFEKEKLTENTNDDKEDKGKKGGSYSEVFKEGEGDKSEVHHMPADSTTDLNRDDGPAIKMDKADHRQTASCGSSNEAREYRAKQKELVEQGKFREALQMDIDDIRDKFGDKYDDAIAEMLEYVDKLETEGRV